MSPDCIIALTHYVPNVNTPCHPHFLSL